MHRQPSPVDGIVLLDKPEGVTSNHALQQVKRLFGVRKAGHTGALDPLATGMLPICLGEATKASGYLLAARKRYRVLAALGRATDTADATGRVVEERPVPELTDERVEAALRRFRGDIEQVPPMYSALKHQGRRLYQLARAGRTVERDARRVRIDELRLRARQPAELDLEVCCSKGTYIRTLVEDLALALGTVGHVVRLRRLAVEPFAGDEMVSIETLQALSPQERAARWLLPIDRALEGLPPARVGGSEARRLMHGQPVSSPAPHPAEGLLRIYGPAGALLGVGEQTADGRLLPRRMFAAPPESADWT